uniref:Retrovirus-related Pol polyprotein from transposon TNT 1-94 n=1 Tax=Tanacetum cinerariifolium TaxID=118510 RepID=A0A6L2MW09_TANCI|nr:retrovirus-related Pol polyprotein from transposon TNT 1-94 [Tanacetum cinerariifolium]
MKEKGDLCILVGYSTQSKGYHVYNKRTRMIVESIHIRFDEIKEVSETSVANDTSGLVPQQQNASDYKNSDPIPQLQCFFFSRCTCSIITRAGSSIWSFVRKALYGLKQAPRAWYDELSKFLTSKGFTKGLQIHQSPCGIFINQAKYALEILHKHGMEKGQSIGTPIAMKPKLDADLSGNPVDQTDYCSKIGSLVYLTSSRPDIVQAKCFCARYQSRPTEKHLKEVKRIFRYLIGTVNMGLWYLKGSSFALTTFSDADHAGCIDTRKSTSGGIQFLGDKLVSWMSKKQDCTAMSSAEAEYVALSTRCAQFM